MKIGGLQLAPSRTRPIVGIKLPWAATMSMTHDVAAEFELGAVYWLEEKQPDFLRPEFRRRARVAEICHHAHGGYVTISFVAVPNPPVRSQETDPESRQLASGIVT